MREQWLFLLGSSMVLALGALWWLICRGVRGGRLCFAFLPVAAALGIRCLGGSMGVYGPFFLLLFLASEEDRRTHEVTDLRTLEIVLLALAAVPADAWGSHLAAMAVVFLPQLLLTFVSTRGMGGADMKLSAAGALFLGAAAVPGFVVALLLFLLHTCPRKRTVRKAPQAFVPYLSAGFLAASYFQVLVCR